MSNIILNDFEVRDDLEIFLLEDTVTYQKRMVTCLRSIGFKGEITIASTLAEAKKLISVKNPGLILSDYNLPDGFGIDFLKLIRSHKKFDNVPVLMVTTVGEVSNIVNAVNAGADGYVVKPFYETEVIEKIGFALEKRNPDSGGLNLSGLGLKLRPT